MRLRRLDLTRYGKFTDEAIDFGAAPVDAPDLHIIYGLNEAGKSTALSAYLDLLFGIENTSRYGFHHPYPSMQVGGVLEFGGGAQDVVRVKARVNSLLDATRQPINEAVLSVPLAGLTRDSYRSMFSLDDQSLEDGGNAIIASKGELGELLFAASAGLADLGTALARVRDEADAIHKQRGRTTQIAELKRQLVDLKTERDAIDTRASAYAALVAALSQAQNAYDEAIRDQALAKARHEELSRILRAAPLASEYRRLSAELTRYGTLPNPPLEWAAQLPGLMVKDAELGTQIAGTTADIARIEGEIAAIEIDPQVLGQGPAILALGDGMARFTTAETDLPRRHSALAEDEAVIAAILKNLGRPEEAAPERLLLPAALTGTFEDLIEARSGHYARLETAQRELELATESLERAGRDLEVEAGAPGADDASLEGVNAALGALRRSDHRARMRMAERALPSATRNFEALRDGLAPWSGDGDSLRAIALPPAAQLERWRGRARDLEKRGEDHRERQRDLLDARGEQTARIAVIRETVGTIDDKEAARLRAQRDAAWSVHRKSLDAKSAAAFSAALEADDALGATRLSHAQDLAQLRSLQLELAATEANLARQQATLREIADDLAALSAELTDALNGQIALPPSSSPSVLIEQIESWSRRRLEALSAWEGLSEIERDRAAAEDDLRRELAVLAEAMTLAGFESLDELSPEAMMQAAETALNRGGSQQALRSAAQKSLRERKDELALRQKATERAQQAVAAWQSDWSAALAQSWFSDDGVGAVRELLRALADLPAALTQRNARARQIETMARDQADFVAQLEAILKDLGEALEPGRVAEAAQRLQRRHEAAQQAHRLQTQKVAERGRLSEILRALQQDMDIHATRKSEMTGFFGVDTLEQVSGRLEEAAERTRLVRHIDALGGQLTVELRTDDVETALARLEGSDLTQIEGEAAEQAMRLDDLEATSRLRFAERARAREQLEAIGGDDAVARIEARRRTVLLDIEDKAMTYLRLKAGALVAEKALQAYREQHRSSMMEKASQAFALITRGDYTGLAARPDKDRETLIGLPRQGGSKLASDMSKGTQFQLYLALRMAGYQEFARNRPPVPFVADDIMETFDEPRSEQVFRLLGEMARIGQVIYLTHHRHLCDIARSVVPGVPIHTLP